MARTSPFEEDDRLLPSIVVVGTPGDDNLEGSGEDDRLVGRRGNDNLTGLAGDDRLIGGRGLDELRGGPGNDLLRGGGNADELYGDEGDDVLRGGSGRDRLEGEDGNDSLFGGAGRDFLRGGSGSDLLIGGGGVDELVGRSGFDRLDGGRGFDSLAGGPNSDVFEFTVLDGKLDRITDFEVPEETSQPDGLDLSALVPISTTDANLGDFVRQTERADGKLIEVRPAGSAEFVELALITRTDIDDLTALQLGLDDIPDDVTTDASLPSTGTGTATSRVQQPGDQDWFRLELLAERDYTFDLAGAIDLDGNLFPNGLSAPVLELRDADGALVQADDGGPAAQLSLASGGFDPGTYFLVARGSGDLVGGYELSSSAEFIPTDPGQLLIGDTREGVITQNDQVDLYRIVVDAGETYSVFIEATDPQPEEFLDLEAVIRDEDGLVVTAASLFGTRFDTAEFEAEATETLTIGVSVSFVASPDAYRLGFNADPPADLTTTAEIAPGDTVFGEIGPEFSDEDWYRIELVAGRSYRFESEGIPGLDLRTADGDLLASDRAGPFGTAEIEFTASTSGTHFLAVLTESTRGSYALSANEVGGDPASTLGTDALFDPGEAAQGPASPPSPAADMGTSSLDALLTAADPAQAATG